MSEYSINQFVESLRKSSINSLRSTEVEVQRAFEDITQIVVELQNKVESLNARIKELEQVSPFGDDPDGQTELS